MTSVVQIATGRSGLMTGGTSVSDASLDAYFYSFTKAQMEARKVNSDPTTGAYFNAMTQSLHDLGWSLFQAKAVIQNTTGTPRIPLIVCAMALLDMIEEGLGSVLTEDRAGLEANANKLCVALRNPPLAISQQLDDWWRNSVVSADLRVMSIGPIFTLLGVPNLTAMHLALKFSASSWRSFVLPATDFKISAQPALMSLNWHTYKSKEAALKAELEQVLTAQVQKTELSLDQAKVA